MEVFGGAETVTVIANARPYRHERRARENLETLSNTCPVAWRARVRCLPPPHPLTYAEACCVGKGFVLTWPICIWRVFRERF